jgi:hypothetical protein
MSDLEKVIADSVNDATVDDSPVEIDTPDVDASPEPVEAPVEASSEEQAPTPEESNEVPSPASKTPSEAIPEEPQDEFEKLAGVKQYGIGGRENRIPYSRVKAITDKKERDLAESVVGRKLTKEEKPSDVLKTHVAQLPELQTKVKDYETRLEAVGKFEDVMENDPEKFLGMLSKLPKYQEFFDFVRQAVQQQQAPQAQAVQQPAAPVVEEPMPEPDETLSDGSKVYSQEGLKKLLDWNAIQAARQAETRVTSKYDAQLKELEDRYKPIKEDWDKQRRMEASLPIIRKQLEDARGWALFNESEEEILEVLRKDQSISLEGAYRQVVFPKLVAERNKVRQDVLKEVKAAPTASSVPQRAASKPTSPTSGPRSIEDIIREQVDTLKR